MTRCISNPRRRMDRRSLHIEGDAVNRLPSPVRGHGPLLCLAFLALTLAGCGGGGGGGSSAPTPTGPTLTSVSPGYTAVGATSQDIEAVGTGFTAASTLDWNGTVLVTTYVSATELKATVPSGDLVRAGQYPVTAVEAGLASNAVEYRVDGPLTATSLSPATANVGDPATQLTVTGTGFVPDSVVQWNGAALATTFVSVTELQAAIPPADLSALGSGAITVSNPTENKSNTWPLDFAVGYSVAVVDNTIADMVYDSTTQLIYASVGSNSQTKPNSLLLIDPTQGTIKSTVAVANNPDVLAISDDNTSLYVGLDAAGAVQRFALPGLTPDLSIPLGTGFYAVALAVAPGAPHTVAISPGRLGFSPSVSGPVSIFDDATARSTTVPQPPNYIFNLQWGATSNVLYSGDGDISSYEFYTLGVTSGGVSIANEYSNVFDSSFNSIHYDSALIYADNGEVVNPTSGTVVGSFTIPAQFSVMIPDSANGKAYFAYTAPGTSPGLIDVVIESFNISTHAPIAKITLPAAYNTYGAPQKLIRWGADGLAVRLSPGYLGTLIVIESSVLVN